MTDDEHRTPGTAAYVAAAIRAEIHAGHLHPGERLTEPAWCDKLGVSRNSLREGFRLLVRDKLADYRVHKGVFIHTVDDAELADLYAFRHYVEIPALATCHGEQPYAEGLAAMHAAVTAATACDRAGDSEGMAAANTDFHLGVIALVGIETLSAAAHHVFDRVRLAFLGMDSRAQLHRDYHHRNLEIYQLVAHREHAAAAAAMRVYLQETHDRVQAARR